MKRQAVQVGQHYLSVEGGYFGGRGPEWEVVSVTEKFEGVKCVRLAMTRDPTQRITIAVSVLQTPRMYRLVSD